MAPTFSFETTAEVAAQAFSEDIAGKNVLITGTSINGIGFEAAKAIAKYANLLIITGYNDERLKLSQDALVKENPKADIRRLVLNLSSLDSVRKAAAEVLGYSEPIHVVVHNAAAPFVKLVLSPEGLDQQVATGHVGPFLFTKLITPKLLAAVSGTYSPRVVYVSSGGQAMTQGIDFDHFAKPKAEEYNAWEIYCQVKAANVLMGKEISRRSQGKILGYSLHPGLIFTNIHTDPEALDMLKAFGILTADGAANPDTQIGTWKTLAQGAATTVVAAFDPSLVDSPGAYLDDSVLANDKVAPHASDLANGEKLWSLTEELIGEKFTF